MKEVQGFEIDAGLAYELTDDAVFYLGCIRRKGAVVFETDDSPEDLATVKQLLTIAKEGYFLMGSQGRVHFCVSDDVDRKFRAAA